MRIDIGVRALDPSLAIIAPARAADWPSREELLDYVAAHDIPIALTKKSPYSIDENMWGRSNECGVLEDPWVAPPEDAFQFVVSVADAPDEPQHVVVSFEKGKPVALDGVADGHGRAHRDDRRHRQQARLRPRRHDREPARRHQEPRGLRGRRGAGAHHRAPASSKTSCSRATCIHFKRTIESKLADMIYEGQWFDPLTEACKAFLFQSQERVTGDVRLKFYKGSCVADGRQSDFSLYSYKLATYTHRGRVLAQAAAGFIELWGLPIEVWARVGKEHHLMKELEMTIDR